MHSGPRWNRGSKKQLARIRLRGNWPGFWTTLIAVLGIAALWLADWWAQTSALG